MSQPWLDDIRRRRLVNAELLLEEPLGGADGVIALVVGAYDERPVHTRPLIHSECNWRRRGRSKMPCAMCPLASLVRQFSLALPAHGRRKKAALVAPMLHTNIVYKKYSNIHNYLNEINWSYREGSEPKVGVLYVVHRWWSKIIHRTTADAAYEQSEFLLVRNSFAAGRALKFQVQNEGAPSQRSRPILQLSINQSGKAIIIMLHQRQKYSHQWGAGA